MSKIKQAYYNVYYGIKNLIKWAPIIWNDRDYDWNPLMRILEKKLRNMSELHESYGNAESSNDTAKELLFASFLASKIAEEDYRNEAFGDKKYLIKKNMMQFAPIGKTGSSRIEFTGLSDDEREELLRLYKLEDDLLERDIELLFDLMKKRLRNWWD